MSTSDTTKRRSGLSFTLSQVYNRSTTAASVYTVTNWIVARFNPAVLSGHLKWGLWLIGRVWIEILNLDQLQTLVHRFRWNLVSRIMTSESGSWQTLFWSWSRSWDSQAPVSKVCELTEQWKHLHGGTVCTFFVGYLVLKLQYRCNQWCRWFSAFASSPHAAHLVLCLLSALMANTAYNDNIKLINIMADMETLWLGDKTCSKCALSIYVRKSCDQRRCVLGWFAFLFTQCLLQVHLSVYSVHSHLTILDVLFVHWLLPPALPGDLRPLALPQGDVCDSYSHKYWPLIYSHLVP